MRTALDIVLEEGLALPGQGRAGLLTNTGAVDRAMRPAHEALGASGRVRLERLFAHEHGLHGEIAAGEPVRDQVDRRTGLPVVSLYPGKRPAPAAVLTGLDAVVVDMQERGARYYTVLGTTLRLLALCHEAGVPLFLLDRPNPLGGACEGQSRVAPPCRSLVGEASVPMRHGLTLGELARLAAAERGLGDALEVVAMDGWRRAQRWPALGRPWVGGSPNSNCLEMARLYPATCLIEGTNLSEGRGTAYPFQQIGAPWLDGWAVAERVRPHLPPGIWWRPVAYRPTASKHAGERCEGVMLHLDPDADPPVLGAGLALLSAVLDHAESHFLEARQAGQPPFFDLLAGDGQLRADLAARRPIVEILAAWERDLADWPAAARVVSLYPD